MGRIRLDWSPPSGVILNSMPWFKSLNCKRGRGAGLAGLELPGHLHRSTY